MSEMRVMTSPMTVAMRQLLEETNTADLTDGGARGGDTKIIWNPDNDAEVEAARGLFDKLVNEKRCMAYRVGQDLEADRSRRVSVFDRNAEKLIIVPQIAGG